MSLVDYASSSDDEVSEAEEEQQRREDEQLRIHDGQSEFPKQPPPPSPNLINQTSKSSSNQRPEIALPSLPPPPSFEKLPDASVLLNSASMPVVTGTDDASRVAAAMAESSTRKRDSNGLTSTLPRSKLPKGNLPHSKNVLDTAGGWLVPPQLSGRSNVVTEDISKLFVRRHAEP